MNKCINMTKTITTLGILLLVSCAMHNKEVEVVDVVEAENIENIEKISLPLVCHTVPTKKEQLCLGTTYSPIGPVDDIVFYHRDSKGNLTFIESYQGDIAVHYFDGFSTNGKLLVLGYAEEGHPSFYFHETQKYFAGDTKSIAFISKYEYTHLENVEDNGDVIVGLMEDYVKDRALCATKESLGDDYNENVCVIKYNIYESPNVH